MSAPTFRLDGQTALVTGASRGIGQAMALALAEAGADIIAVSTRKLGPSSETSDLIASTGRSFTSLAADFSDETAIGQLEAALQGQEVDILVNNAGTIRRQPAVEHADEIWREVLEVNLTAPFRLTRALAAPMLERGRGKIIFTASLLSFQGGINVPGYTASKSAIAGLTRALANEWAAQGVNVNAIAPGYIATDNTQALRDDPERSLSILTRIPSERWGRSSDLAGATVFLASSAADYVNGIVLPVDGGWLGR